jgi:hypothetical protein
LFDTVIEFMFINSIPIENLRLEAHNSVDIHTGPALAFSLGTRRQHTKNAKNTNNLK